MIRALLISFCVLFVVSSFSQEDYNEFQTISGNKNGKTKISGVGSMFMSFGQIGNDFAHYMGGGVGVIVNDFFFGGYGMGKTNDIPYRNDKDKKNLTVGHGGFWLGYTFFQNRAIHPVFHTQLGWGGLSKSEELNLPDEPKEIDQFYIVSPTIEIEFNFSRFFKVGAGGSYSFVYGLDNSPYQPVDFAKPSIFLSFKFGWFN